jgi:16S rRNA processing protein RimM
MANTLVKIAVISAAHGIRGQVKIRSFSNPPEAVFTYGTLTDAQGQRTFALTQTGVSQDIFIASIFGVSDRNASEKLKGIELYAPSNVVPKSLSDRILGLEAKLADGSVYGKVSDVYNFGAGDIVEIIKNNGQSEMLPLNKNFVEIRDKYVVVHPPEYVEGEK